MIEMEYAPTRHKPIVLNEGIYRGHSFAVLNLGTHPTAYVECKLDDVEDYDDTCFWDITVHGGLTYFGKAYWDEEDSKKYVGWDYAHWLDWMGYESDRDNIACGNEKHTTAEMTNDCYSVIDQLIEIEGQEALKAVDYNKTYTLKQIEEWLERMKGECCGCEDRECIDWLIRELEGIDR